MSKTLFTAAALSLLLATSGVALAHHKEGHSGGPSAEKSDRLEKDRDAKLCMTSEGELLSPGQWAKAEYGVGLGQAVRKFTEFKNPADFFKNSGLCSRGSDEGDITDEPM